METSRGDDFGRHCRWLRRKLYAGRCHCYGCGHCCGFHRHHSDKRQRAIHCHRSRGVHKHRVLANLSAGQRKHHPADYLHVGSRSIAACTLPTGTLTGYGTITPNGLYTAPPAVPQTNSFDVVATSCINSTAFGIATVAIRSGVVVQITPTAVTIGQGEHFQFSATVGGATNTGVSWSVSTATAGKSDRNNYAERTTDGAFRRSFSGRRREHQSNFGVRLIAICDSGRDRRLSG